MLLNLKYRDFFLVIFLIYIGFNFSFFQFLSLVFGRFFPGNNKPYAKLFCFQTLSIKKIERYIEQIARETLIL